MKKIRILTFHEGINSGAVLQSISLLDYLKETYPQFDTKILDYRPPLRQLMAISKFIKLNPHKAYFGWKRHQLFRNFIEKNLDLDKHLPNYLPLRWLTKAINRQKIDLIITGSDCIWAINKQPHRRYPNPYWLPLEVTSQKASFAPSADGTNEKIFMKFAPKLKKIINNYNIVSVRDNYTMSLIKKIGVTQNIHKIYDPAFFYKFRITDVKQKLKNNGVDLNKKLLLILFPGDNPHLKQTITNFKNKGYQIVGLSMYSRMMDINLGDILDPHEWASVFGLADFCITDRFHGAIFCMKNNTPFIGIPSRRKSIQKNKLFLLLNDCNLPELFIDIYADNFSTKKLIDLTNTTIKQWGSKYQKKVTQAIHKAQKTNQVFLNKVINLIQ